ncbi:MAG TPA: methyltransferase domain-containing protein [Acidimicrobiales bacterium]|nr:methyltransferase domain-containing protein [Acidimicrobiales bacterium]
MTFDRYFDKASDRFSSYYGNERVTRALGRGALFDRLRFAVAKADELGARRVLDVGCGSGPLFEPLASRGIAVTGLEPAPAMLTLARAEAEKFPELIEVREGSWEGLDGSESYDVAIALGVFDYVIAPAELLSRLAAVATSVVASFPSPSLRTEFRKLRYGVRGVKVHGYTNAEIESLADEAGMECAEVQPLGKAGYVVHFARRS